MIDPTYKTQYQKKFSIPKISMLSEFKFFWFGFEFRWNRIYHNKKEHYKFFRISIPSRFSLEKNAKFWSFGERSEKVKNG